MFDTSSLGDDNLLPLAMFRRRHVIVSCNIGNAKLWNNYLESLMTSSAEIAELENSMKNNSQARQSYRALIHQVDVQCWNIPLSSGIRSPMTASLLSGINGSKVCYSPNAAVRRDK
ncbi:hypothetical protein BaRGS_00038513 [Batillaria attramentaria]|uniref:Uncharacterized protein n=1 Tax=Batillaria attramentaria TaxID=370345 RepID=A0ABD0J6K5_9CAEN